MEYGIKITKKNDAFIVERTTKESKITAKISERKKRDSFERKHRNKFLKPHDWNNRI